MKNTYRFLFAVLALVLCIGMLSACGNEAADPTTQKPTETQPAESTAPVGTEPFVAPPDSLGKVVSSDPSLITWNVYETKEETIDFMGINVKELGKPAAEMSLLYLEEEVTYYLVADGKLNPAIAEDVVAGSIVGVTTLEEGVQEVYIIYVPVEDDGSDEYEDVVEEIVEDTVPATTAATEETVIDDGGVATMPTEEVSEQPTEDVVIDEEPSLEEPTEDTEPVEEIIEDTTPVELPDEDPMGNTEPVEEPTGDQ